MSFQAGVFQDNFQQQVSVTVTPQPPLSDGGSGKYKRKQHERLPFSPEDYLEAYSGNIEERHSPKPEVNHTASLPLNGMPPDDASNYVDYMAEANEAFIEKQRQLTEQRRRNMLAAVILLLD